MQRTMRHSLREAIEVVMDSVFPPLFRRGMRLALPAFLSDLPGVLACLRRRSGKPYG